MLPNSIAIFNSNDEFPRNGDQNFPFRQNSDLFYLTGIDQEKTILILFPDSPIEAYKEILFIVETNEIIATWEGHKWTQEEAKAISGIENIYWLDRFESILREIAVLANNIYLNSNENQRFVTEVPYKDIRFAKYIKDKYPLHKIERCAPIMHKLRVIKKPVEVEYIRTASKITGDAFLRVLKFVKPGIKEYEIEAEVLHEFIRQGASGYSFHPIIASGKNSCVLHYIENDKICNDGDIILLDIGAEYGNYAGDLTRCFPVNGKFSERQKQIYNSVLSIMKKAKQILREGVTIDEYHSQVCEEVERELANLKLLSINDIKAQDKNNPLYKKYFMHGTSHFMGMDVHDIGYKQEKIKSGMVFSCEPGIYVKEEGIGIRLENTVLITTNGLVDLTENIPIEIEEIESIMNSKK